MKLFRCLIGKDWKLQADQALVTRARLEQYHCRFGQLHPCRIEVSCIDDQARGQVRVQELCLPVTLDFLVESPDLCIQSF